ncbi:response regulator [Mariprofundus sp. EBB-1]|uniref:ATP-binding protein n=1 Tax=Mariprofundus sp. EBB-1 TaxID=2650971 RepID=UPI000EF278AC|nr:ATP-binding protein [Mariprofundus sp. EBB-1]RLL53300.1 response regulator [Mariprofundus sp. EBB-1]
MINRKKNGEFYPAILTVSPIKNKAGKTTHYIGIQQNLEKFEELEAQFHQSQKMEAVGTLVGGIAHDFNNTLAGITGNLYLAKKAAYGLPDVVKRLGVVEKLSFSAAATIQQLLAFSRKGIVEMHPLSIGSFLKETIKMQQVSVPENIHLELNITGSDMQVNGDLNQLQQVLMNLINNAFDAVQGVKNPSITIHLNRYLATAEFLAKHEDVDAVEYAVISVVDNGCGIKDKYMDHIFEPFFTTKEPGKGTGLGLAMGYGALRTHNGVIEAKSSGKGTTMKVYLPLIESDGEMNIAMNEDAVVNGKGETILLVDDNKTVLETGRDVLEGLGYRVLVAEDGLAAIEVYSEQQFDIDLLILDVVMPRLGGVEALQSIREINPDVKAMFATGYDKLSALGVRGENSKEKVISKPFAVSELSQVVREILDR